MLFERCQAEHLSKGAPGRCSAGENAFIEAAVEPRRQLYFTIAHGHGKASGIAAIPSERR
jgi:hypothetical protein